MQDKRFQDLDKIDKEYEFLFFLSSFLIFHQHVPYRTYVTFKRLIHNKASGQRMRGGNIFKI